jgi:hypothetical protein
MCVTLWTVYYCLLFSKVPLHFDRIYIMKYFVRLAVTLILTKVQNCTVFIQIQHLAASNYCSASCLTFMMYLFKFSVAVVCIVIFLHILIINVYFLPQYVVHQISDISNHWWCAQFPTLCIKKAEFRNLFYVFSTPRAATFWHECYHTSQLAVCPCCEYSL